MASSLKRIPLHRVSLIRNYSAAGQQALPIGGTQEYQIQQAKLPNNLVVASADNGSAISRVAIVFRAGARDETSENLGTAHVLRICAGISTKNLTQFGITRHIQQLGGSLTVQADREVIAYVLEGTRDVVAQTLPILSEVATQPAFKPWEVSDNTQRMRLERKQLSPQLRAIDIFHKAAFRTGLGNSLYCPKYNLGKISSETLQHFVSSNCIAGRGAVVGVGVNQDNLIKYAQSLKVNDGAGSSPASKYKGGEVRIDKGRELAFVVIGGEGSAASDAKAANVSLVLQRALGTGPAVAYGNQVGPLANLLGAGSAGAVTAVNFNYSDTGLIGILIAAPSDEAGDATKKAVAALKSAKVTDKDVQRAKNQLKTAIWSGGECGGQRVHTLAWQAVQNGSVRSPADLVKDIDAVSVSDVTGLLQKATSKLSIGAFGNLASVPYLDELK